MYGFPLGKSQYLNSRSKRCFWCKSTKALKHLFLNLQHSSIFAIVKAKNFEKQFCKIISTNFHSDIDPISIQSHCKHKPREIYLKPSLPSTLLSFSPAILVLRSKIKNLQTQIFTVHLILLLAKKEREGKKKPATNLQVTLASPITDYFTEQNSFSRELKTSRLCKISLHTSNRDTLCTYDWWVGGSCNLLSFWTRSMWTGTSKIWAEANIYETNIY